MIDITDIFYPEYICQPTIFIARGDWWHVTIECDHGQFQTHISSYADIDRPLELAMEKFNEYKHTRPCWKATPIPKSWLEVADWGEFDTVECDLFEGHDGPCDAFETFEDEKPRRLIVRYTNR